jgi:RNA polymerase sigma-70 factor (ECF subfamily)
MSLTSLSLLDRLKGEPTPADWSRLHDLYRPLVRGWLARIPGVGDEADDLTQEVLVVVLREVAGFERQREGSFRAWLRRVAVNRVRVYWRQKARRPRVGLDGTATEDFLGQLEDPAGDLAAQWDRDHDRHVFDRLLAAVRPDFGSDTWEAFRRFALDQVPARQVAAELGTTENAVLLAKSRVLKRLRDEAGVLLD